MKEVSKLTCAAPKLGIYWKSVNWKKMNKEVKQLQTRLRDQNFFPYNIESTGWFGSVTQGAVNIFQKFYKQEI